MQITYLSDWFYSTGFIYGLLFLTLAIWLLMKVLFSYDSMSKALVFAIIAIVFLPFVVSAAQVGTAFVLAVLLGGLVVSQAYKWPIITSVLAVLLALLAGAVLLPSL